ncbi:MAG: YigZ family protein [Clostridiales bacterium]|nr:YigZ family protein [Clostridiales bacterium]
MKSYKTVFAYGEDELSINKSRFIGYATPVESEAEAVSFIEKIKKKHWNATHNVPVYIVGEDMMLQRYSDDGEPSGTAGVPVLEMLKKEGITNVCIVMTRYFGGVKLGTGGLVRAYTQTAKVALDAAGVVEKSVYTVMDCEMDYHFHGKVRNHLMDWPEIIIGETVYTDKVIVTLYIPPEKLEAVTGELVEWTSDQVTIVVNEDVYLTTKDGKIFNG